jgi:holo-[acyl-carrier protein] synthase
VSAIVGIGVDLVQIARMERLLERHGKRALDKLLTADEQRELQARAKPARSLAMCWAAKEACVKAMGCGFDGIAFKDVALVRDARGKPELTFSPAHEQRLRALGVGAAHVSLSDDGGIACAYVVLERA